MNRALYGVRSWLLQRLTAVYLLGFLAYFLLRLLNTRPLDFPAWRAWLTAPAMGVAVLLFFGALLYHAWVGLRDVVIDYVKPLPARLALLTAIGAALAFLGLWVLIIVTRAGT